MINRTNHSEIEFESGKSGAEYLKIRRLYAHMRIQNNFNYLTVAQNNFYLESLIDIITEYQDELNLRRLIHSYT